MLPLPRHLLTIDPEEVVHEIEDDPLSQFLWSVGPTLEKLTRQRFGRLSRPTPPAETTCTDSAQ
jgi:hypothetical protein